MTKRERGKLQKLVERLEEPLGVLCKYASRLPDEQQKAVYSVRETLDEARKLIYTK